MRSKPAWYGIAASVVVYFALALAAYHPAFPWTSARIPTCACGDPALQTWFIGWIPFALSHLHNPLFSLWTNYPVGVNLEINTSMPLLGLITVPITLAAGPVASYNTLLYLAFPLSAAAMFFVLRRWTGSTVAAFVGGLVYGFSAYSVNQGVGHVMLSFVPLPPLLLYQAHKLVTRQESSPVRAGLALGVLAVAQFYIEPEILATVVVLGALAAVVLWAFHRSDVTVVVLRRAGRGLVAAAIVTIVFVAYPLWFALHGPVRYSGPAHPIANPWQTDLIGAVFPTSLERYAPAGWETVGDRLSGAAIVENGSYLGFPLLLLLIVLAVRFRRDRRIGVMVSMVVISYVLSLGRRLAVNGHVTSIPLPFALLVKLPLFNNVLPARLSLLTVLFVAGALAVGLADVQRSMREGRTGRHASRSRPWALIGVVSVLSVLSAVALIPRWPYGATPTAVPAYFTSSDVRSIPDGSVVLTYPFPIYPDNQAMLWQSVARMRFKEVGTYAIIPNAQGVASLTPSMLQPALVQEFFAYQELGTGGYLASAPPVDGHLVRVFRRYLRRYSISTVLVADTPTQSTQQDQVLLLMRRALGASTSVGGVQVWYDVPQRLIATSDG